MMKDEFISEFEWIGKRRYVHSTTMILALKRIFSTDIFQLSQGNNTFIDCKFGTEITKNGVFKLSQDRTKIDSIKTKSATFRVYNDYYNYFIAFIEDPSRPVTKSREIEYEVKDLDIKNRFEGKCKIYCSDYASFLKNIIEANKQVHLNCLDDWGMNLKVNNAFMKRFPFCEYSELPNQDGFVCLNIENKSVHFSRESVTTLNILSMPELEVKGIQMGFTVQRF